MEKLPVELRRNVLDFCDIESIKSIRQTCKSWAMLGEEQLLSPTFISLLHRDDFTRLQNISQHPRLSKYIHTLKINIGEMNEYQSRHNTFFLHYTQEPELRDKLLKEAWGEFNDLQKRKASFADRQFPGAFVEESFVRLPNLKSLDVRMNEFPYENDLLRKLWNIPSTRKKPRRQDPENLYMLLSAIQILELQSFRHDKFPLDFFRYSDYSLQKAWSGLEGLTSLHLNINCESVAHEDIPGLLAKVATWVMRCPNLHTLELKIDPGTSIVPESLNIVPHFEDFTWTSLHTLLLSNDTDLLYEDLVPFLLKHAKTLRRVALGVPMATWNLEALRPEDFFRTLNSHLRLDKFYMQGSLEYFLIPVKLSLEPLYDENWKRVRPNDLEIEGPAEEFEDAVIHGLDETTDDPLCLRFKSLQRSLPCRSPESSSSDSNPYPAFVPFGPTRSLVR